MAEDDKVTVVAQLLTVEVDRSRYKKYQPLLAFKNVYVTLHVPKEECVEEDGSIIVTANGLTAILGELAVQIDNLEEYFSEQEAKKAEQSELELQTKGAGEQL